MTEDVDFDFEDFRTKVWNDFSFLRSRKRIDEISTDEIKDEFRKDFRGCFFIPFLNMIDRFGEIYFYKEAEKRNFREFEKEAEDLLAHAELKKIICKALKDASQTEILTEDKFFNTVTKTLAEKDLRKQFVIPLEPMLFACVLLKILETGMGDFCLEI